MGVCLWVYSAAELGTRRKLSRFHTFHVGWTPLDDLLPRRDAALVRMIRYMAPGCILLLYDFTRYPSRLSQSDNSFQDMGIRLFYRKKFSCGKRT